MVEKIGIIKNPLTIIAIFAAIAEISGTLVLPFLTVENQGIFIWFAMMFPLLLVILFFITLNFNRKVLYAPSDFRDENNYFKSFIPASPTEVTEKLKEQAIEAEAEAKETLTESESELITQAPKTKSDVFETSDNMHESDVMFSRKPSEEAKKQFYQIPISTTLQAKYSLSEELVLNKISKEYELPIEIKRNMRMQHENGSSMIFDGVIFHNNKITIIEVKFARNIKSLTVKFRDILKSLIYSVEQYYAENKSNISVIIAIVTDSSELSEEQFEAHKKNLLKALGTTPFKVDIRIYELKNLMQELN